MSAPTTTLSHRMKELYHTRDDILERVQNILDEYKNTEFWRGLVISQHRLYWGSYKIILDRYPKDTYRTVNGDHIEFHPIKGAKLGQGMYMLFPNYDKEKEERYIKLLQEITDKINKKTVLQRFMLKKLLDDYPELERQL